MAIRKTRTATRRTATTRRTQPKRVLRPWSREEVAFMRKYYRKYETAWIARQLGRTVYAVRYKAVDLNIKKASPTIWRGNKGPAKAFKSPTRKPAVRKVAKRRTTTKRTYRAATPKRRTTARKTTKRRTVRKRR